METDKDTPERPDSEATQPTSEEPTPEEPTSEEPASEEPTPEEALPSPAEASTALADAVRVKQEIQARSATPWPLWFATVLTAYVALFPFAYGGMLSDREWLLPNSAWAVTLGVSTLLYLGLFTYVGAAWRRRTGVALRFDVLPRKVTVPLTIGLPVLLMGSAWAFKATAQPLWLIAASVAAAAVSIAFHLLFVRLHRKVSPASYATA
ncbi:Rossmann-fold NAD(P)-binding domain-containing protein [Streptomyces cavernicola]|uniref:Uncharacterized protein n=1 Tax=Streptomyces cavernicola TaxID=3043613 RepID=A0ABT6SDL2_9ACTN|nr:hypothetical protein [Streptomyces sp. B-S-A6]MDI3406255.1 hypothetical protein [Streptomyces sp. B-S-A6]